MTMVLCSRIAGLDVTDWGEIERAFSKSPPLALAQPWLETAEPGFQPATVRIGWEPEAFWAYADIVDRDIFNAATRHNEYTWRLGDVFELFLRPLPTQPWLELHVTPENQQLQLLWPNNHDIFALYEKEGLKPFLKEERSILSYTQIDRARNRWRVLAKVPIAAINGEPSIQAGDEWLFSFCRYDATRGVKEPILSSSSPLTLAKFDNQDEWRKATFIG